MSLRDEMPDTATAVDELREVFGADLVNAAIRRGMNGLPHGFYAEENGMTFGPKTEPRGAWVSLKDIIIEKKGDYAGRG